MVVQDSLVREHRCLYMKMAKERHHRNRQKVIDLQRLIVLQILLYILYEMRSEGPSCPSLQDLLTCSELGLTGNQEEELHVINEEWITSLIRNSMNYLIALGCSPKEKEKAVNIASNTNMNASTFSTKKHLRCVVKKILLHSFIC